MGSSRKGSKDGSTKRGGRRPVVAQSIDAGEDQPHDTRGNQRKNDRKKKSNNRSVKINKDDESNDEDVQLKRHLAELGLEWVEMNADGNCLFRSLSDQLCGDFGSKHTIIRKHICDYMEKNKEDFEVFLVYEDEDDHEQQEEDARDFEHYIEQMREDGDWGGHLELMAAARLFR
jgi:OTU domain-containing protein 3